MKFLSFSGSNRKGSINVKAATAITQILSSLGHEATMLDLTVLKLDIYDGDAEKASGLPDGAKQLKQAIHDHDALIIGCPEYNGYMTPQMLNALDWATRSESASPDLSAFRDRPVLIVCASPGGMGGTRAASQLRTFLTGIGCLVLPDVFSVPGAMQAFADDGTLADERMQQRADNVAHRFAEYTRRNTAQDA
jgi:chromate reductase, NAD(P)H dehydrogenase (quinone)